MALGTWTREILGPGHGTVAPILCGETRGCSAPEPKRAQRKRCPESPGKETAHVVRGPEGQIRTQIECGYG